jgi:chemotaxis protein methyltransferase CheR
VTLLARTEPDLEAVLRFLAETIGLSLTPARREHAQGGIARAMERSGARDVAAYLERLRRGDALLDDLITEVTVGETYFFRDPAQFEAIRSEILPDFARRRPADRPFRAWSAGCASGEEPYSLAIVLGEAGLAGHAHLLGTDVSRPALARAREARYGRWSLRGVDEKLIGRFFAPDGTRLRLDERLRRAVEFRFLNLALDAYPSAATGTWGMDLILCRNVLIYLGAEAVDRIARALHASLSEGGWLVTGPSDPPLDKAAPFEAIVLDGGVVYRRRGGPARIHPVAPAVFQPPPPWTTGPAPAPPSEPPPRAVTLAPEPPAARPSPPDPLAAARAAFSSGSYERALRIAGEADGPEAACLRVRAHANLRGAGPASAEAAVEAMRHPLSPEVQFLHALLLSDVGDHAEAERAVRRTLYLDRTLAVAHFLLGSILRKAGDRVGAGRAFRNARNLAAAHPARTPLPLSEGEHAERLVAAAASELALLDESGKVTP